jgi:hypothetical protein
MKRILSGVVFALFFAFALQAKSNCPNPETIQRLQELQRCIDSIKSNVTSIQININDLDVDVSGIDDLEVQISILGEVLCSKIDNISVTVDVSGIDVLASGIEDLESLVSVNDELIISTIDEQASASDALLCSKVGDLDDLGTCLETLIDVPDDIDNLNLNVIELLKTILLELRGCNQCP